VCILELKHGIIHFATCIRTWIDISNGYRMQRESASRKIPPEKFDAHPPPPPRIRYIFKKRERDSQTPSNPRIIARDTYRIPPSLHHNLVQMAPTTDSLVPETPQFHQLDKAADLFDALRINGSGNDGHGPQHDIAPNSHAQAERARTALALGQRNAATGLATPQISRPATPYTLNPPVDFDGLSWPSIGFSAEALCSGIYTKECV
jgi:hypothetical protein